MPTVPLPHHARAARRRSRPRWLAVASLGTSAIESALVRSSVGALAAGRHACGHCHRTPLVGEWVHLYGAGKRGDELVCELCRPLRVAAPDRTVRVRSAEQAGSVRPIAART